MKTRDRENLKKIYKIVDKKEGFVFDLLFTEKTTENAFRLFKKIKEQTGGKKWADIVAVLLMINLEHL